MSKSKIIVQIIIILVVVGAAFAGWNSAEPSKPAVDLKEYLIAAPLEYQYTYGNTERTRVMYNLIFLKKQIDDLEFEIIKLQAIAKEAATQKGEPKGSDPKKFRSGNPSPTIDAREE